MADVYSDDEDIVLTVGKKRSSPIKAKSAVRGRPKHDEDDATNGVENSPPGKGGRGRKGGKKQNATVIAATGKGGRSKVVEEDAEDDSDDPKSKKAKIVASKGAGPSPDRHKKVKGSDDESSEEKVDNKVKRGRGRPKKSETRGRKKGHGGALKTPYQPTGKPRGRAKKTADEDEPEEDIDEKEDDVQSVSD